MSQHLRSGGTSLPHIVLVLVPCRGETRWLLMALSEHLLSTTVCNLIHIKQRQRFSSMSPVSTHGMALLVGYGQPSLEAMLSALERLFRGIQNWKVTYSF